MIEATRPDPDELLKAIQSREGKRGFLKVFLGASAGVGKTYAMLGEAHEQRARGVDIVIGYVVTHGRAETERLVDGLEVIPPKTLTHRGTNLQEVNVEAIIARAPEIVLVDELAHSNAPGSTHAKRWQDINDLLAAGISVFTAVNIQHLASLNDVVTQVTGVRVQETVPDSFFEQADEIELIDLAPAELQQRLKEGKVYVPERIEHALEGFFKTSNLTALRELALRRTADTVDAEMQRLRIQEGTRGTWATRDRIVVCIAPNPMGPRVVRAAARMAAANHAELIALYVESDRQSNRGHQDHDHARQAMELAEELGFELVHLNSHDIVSEIIGFANRRNATLIVVGKPIKARWKEVLFGSVVDELVRVSGDVDVHVISSSVEAPTNRWKNEQTGEIVTRQGLILAMTAAALSTAIAFALFNWIGTANVSMLYVLVVALSATKCNRYESGLLSLICVLAFNYCFVDPRFTFAVSDARYLVLFIVMVTIGLVISSLTSRLRDQVRLSSERERRTASLYSLSRQLVQGRSKVEISKGAAREIGTVFNGEVAVLVKDENGLEVIAASESGFEESSNERAVAGWVLDHLQSAGLGTDTLPGSRAIYLPLKGAEQSIGVLAFKPQGQFESTSQRQLLETFANGLGVALERIFLAKKSNEALLSAESERIRSTLLSSISHDLRTPLTSITGAASSLVHGRGDTKELSETIYSESMRLNQQIQNLLDMTRLQSGNVELNLSWQSPQELVASAIEKAAPALANRQLEVNHKGALGLFQADGLLIEKALVNLLENAGKFTKEGDSIKVTVFAENSNIVFLVTDTGPGIAPSVLSRIFSAGFHTEGGGFGLGLSIVEAIARLHKGRCSVTNLPSGGAAFRIEFPRPDRQPEVPNG